MDDRRVLWTASLSLLVLLLVAALQFRVTSAQTVTQESNAECLQRLIEDSGQSSISRGVPRNCVSHTSRNPCNFRNFDTTPKPGFNQYGMYSLRPGSGQGAGGAVCDIRRRGYRIEDITTLANDPRLKFVYSPGLQLAEPQRYPPRHFYHFNISCDNFLYFNLTSIDLEAASCTDPNTCELGKVCVDYIERRNNGGGSSIVCGTEAKDTFLSRVVHGNSNFSISLRTNPTKQFAGFRLSVICFDENPDDEPPANCTMPADGSNPTIPSDPPISGKRKRRSLEAFHAKWKTELEHLRRRKRQVDNFDFRFQRIDVPLEVEVFYRENTLIFGRDSQGQPFMDPIPGIFVLSTFDGSGDTPVTFQGDARMNNTEQVFLGPGPLTILSDYAYFQLFLIDPRGIMPNAAERAVISNLTEAQYGIIIEDESSRLSEEEIEGDCFDPVREFDLPGPTVCPPRQRARKRRQAAQTEQRSELLPDSAIETAIRNENACNPVLRTTAQATIDFMQQNDQTRLDMIRDRVAAEDEDE